MRTFSCFTTTQASSTPTHSFIMAADEERARVLALRELKQEPKPVSLELCENGRVLWAERLRS